MSTRETVTVFCPGTHREVIGLVKRNPRISNQAKIVWEYDFIYCTGQQACNENIHKNCPFLRDKKLILH